jgi:hypothetical protein
MTIAITVKVHDGVVLAADSASTLFSQQGTVDHVYNNANKVFNLYKCNTEFPNGLPIGVITYGLGGIGNSSISTLIKDFRKTLMNREIDFDPSNYQIRNVAENLKEFIFEKHYKPTFKEAKPFLGFFIAGYSSNATLAEEWRIEIIDGQCSDPLSIRKNEDVGIAWGGESRAIHRLILGFDPFFPEVLKEMGMKEADIPQAMKFIQSKTEVGIIPPAMPIQDAIDVAKFLADTTSLFTHFLPQAPTVGGPIEIATITKHEGFKWITRKHYFDNRYNQGC